MGFNHANLMKEVLIGEQDAINVLLDYPNGNAKEFL
jgi:hypothetical protein